VTTRPGTVAAVPGRLPRFCGVTSCASLFSFWICARYVWKSNASFVVSELAWPPTRTTKKPYVAAATG
jgi:hypothetical protein